MSDTDGFSDIELLARTLYGECRGEPELGQEAVACTIMNRVNHPCWWGHDLRSVILKPFQYSAWLLHDPNRPLILSPDLAENPVYQRCLDIAERAVCGLIDDPTHGSTHYERIGTDAAWAKGVTPQITIGHHQFFKLN